MWAFGCIIYQMLVGKPPFRGESEYLTFQKILNREIVFPEDMCDEAQDLINKLLELDPTKRLGATVDDYVNLKAHPFFSAITFDSLFNEKPPEYTITEEALQRLASSMESKLHDSDEESMIHGTAPSQPPATQQTQQTQHARESSNPDDIWQKHLLADEKIVFTGLISKRRGIFAKKRQLILTDLPRFLYFNPITFEKRGQIDWSAGVWAEISGDKAFYIHTPKRDYYMQGISCTSKQWVDVINKLRRETQEKS